MKKKINVINNLEKDFSKESLESVDNIKSK